jgi:hypothetical protein
MGTVTLSYTDERNVVVFMNNSVVVPAGGYLKVQAGKVKNPACTKAFGGFELITGDKDKNHAIFTDKPTVATTTPGSATGSV